MVLHCAQLEAIGRHDYNTADDYLSSELKAKVSLAQFQEQVQKNRIVETNHTSDFLDRRFENNVLRMSGTVEALGGGAHTPAQFVVVKEGAKWVIQEYEF
jgi:uncharacterized protein DUF4864